LFRASGIGVTHELLPLACDLFTRVCLLDNFAPFEFVDDTLENDLANLQGIRCLSYFKGQGNIVFYQKNAEPLSLMLLIMGINSLTNMGANPSEGSSIKRSLGDVENRIKEGKNKLRWDKTSCHRFATNEARLLMGVLSYNLLHMLRQFYLMGEEVKRSMERLIKRLIKVGAKVAYHGRRWQVHVASAFPLARHYRAVFG
jgi:hypothetical protein